jgi:hypothetical protein
MSWTGARATRHCIVEEKYCGLMVPAPCGRGGSSTEGRTVGDKGGNGREN